MDKPTLIYFPARGRAELIRVLLADAGVDYHEHPVGSGTPPESGRPTDFAELKKSGLLPFEAVPVWEEPDGFRLAQSMAIARHIARGHDRYGRSVREAALCDQMLGAYEDVRGEIRRLVTVDATARPKLRAELDGAFLPRWFGHLERLLVANHGGAGFAVGETATIADVALWTLLEFTVDNGFHAALEGVPRLRAYAERIGARPGIAAWVKSPRRAPLLKLPV